ncbi:MAG TPA: SDR family oxidoreductase [Rhizomicrobium sp.]|nr:SDR family oxidoreductase [Rhizomicrobium sp.]
MPDLFDLADRTALVTGASRGIGAAIARGLADVGATVTGFSRSGTGPAGVAHHQCDVTDITTARRVLQSLPRLDILVHAAGISLPDGDPIERFRNTLDVNLISPYALTMAALPLLQKSSAASVINITSINSQRGFPGNPGYVAAKAGLAGLTRALAVDIAPIRVNALAPGYVHTEMTAKSHADPVLRAQRRRHTVLGRWGDPGDLVGAAIFLASDASAYVTGQEIFVDGGWTVNGLLKDE